MRREKMSGVGERTSAPWGHRAPRAGPTLLNRGLPDRRWALVSRSFHPAHKLRVPLVALVLTTVCTLTMAVLVPTVPPASALSGPAP